MFTNYKYYTDNKSIVIAVSTYAGKKVKGIAKCDPRDKFDLDDGKALAAARCNLKIAKKRNKRARKKYIEATEKLNKANNNFHRVCEYLKDSDDAVKNAENHLNRLSSRY